ncbi:helix-turn-helix domain containing protein [Clostridium tyrobutyricum]|uniref:helix-turn-helix domain-containing protein n=1 Tax=Clostridium tyrobutyricum TaxID=1519 RepID=UPI001C390EEA|nr:helix-turn-helix domain-containing protein [Clostridium tyrobutyricum]MBV4420163.1 helix-turn-helix domain containing protein [Clostridium tyrobutyricum]
MLSVVLNEKQEKMISMLIEGETIAGTARAINVTRSTIYSWLSKDNIKAELNKRRQEIVNQGNNYILKDVKSYISKIKELAKDKSDKRTCLAANQYLLNRVYGNTTSVADDYSDAQNDTVDENELARQLEKFKRMGKID